MNDRSPADSVSPVRHLDLVLLAAALPAFLAAGVDPAGYAIFAAVWVIQHFAEIWTGKAALRKIEQRDRSGAMGLVVGGLLGRVALVTISILLIGELIERQAGLASAITAAVLVTVSMITRAISRPRPAPAADPGEGGEPE